jgi:hypothetical protein
MNKKNLGMLGIIVLAIVLISITIYSVNKEKQDLAEQESVIETVYVGFDDEKVLDNFSREDAVMSLRALLIEIKNDPEDVKKTEVKVEDQDENDEVKAEDKTEDQDENDENKTEDTITRRLERLDNEETDIEDVLTKEAIDMIYFSEEFGKDKFNRQFAASALLIYHELIMDAVNSDDFKPVIESFDQIVYLDNKFMTAHIPLDIFVGSGTGVAFEMQYVDGEWKLNPYTAMMSLNMMGVINESIEQ